MNRNLQGTELSNDELIAIAIEAGADTAQGIADKMRAMHGDNAVRSMLLNLTTTARYAMFAAGKLNLDTRDRYNQRSN